MKLISPYDHCFFKTFYPQNTDDRTGWLPKYRIYLINGNVVDEPTRIAELYHLLGSVWQAIWQPGNTLVIDESMYDFKGEAPCHMYCLFSMYSHMPGIYLASLTLMD